MKNLTYKVLAIAILFAYSIFAVNAQESEYEQEMKKLQEQQEKEMQEMVNEYEDFIKKEQEAFENYIKQADAEFSKYLKGQWDAFAVIKGQKQNAAPGPQEVPVFDPAKITKKEVKTFTVSKGEADMAPRQVETMGVPVLPNEQILKEKDFSAKETGIGFYGTNVRFEYDQALEKTFSGSINEGNISKYWDELCGTKYFHLLDQLLGFKTEFSLNDWGYYMLVSKIAAEIEKEQNANSLLTWFLMIKSGYKIKIGYSDNKIYLMLPSNTTLYGMSYFTFNGLAYYVPGLKGEKIYTYKKDFADSRLIFDLNITNPMNLGSDAGKRDLSFNYAGKEYKFTVLYNKSLIDFYNDYPQCEIGVFFNASVSRIAKESLLEKLKPIVSKMSQLEAANFLLTFVQTAFEYKTDQEQFDREKFFFAEEVLHYPYCDCEDRSVFYSFLVKELLGIDIVGLNYPGHIATAVLFTDKVTGDVIAYKDKKYIIADPTYINAPVGLTMPDYREVKPGIVEIDNLQNKEQMKRQLWEKIFAGGGSRGDNGQDVVFDEAGNAYVTGFFTGEALFGNFKLSTSKEEKDIFIAKLDKKGNFVWAQQAKGKGNEVAFGIALDKNGNALITGTFDKEITFGGKSLKVSDKPDAFISKYDKNGQLLWANKVGLDTVSDLLPNKVYMANFSSTGKLIGKKFFSETEYFDKYGVVVDSTGNAFVTGSFSTALAMGNSKDVVTNTAAQVSFSESMQLMASKLIEGNYSPEVIGLFAFIQSIRANGAKVEGKTIQEAIDKSNPEFKNTSPKVYKNLGDMSLIKNASGIVSINIGTGQSIQLNTIKIDNNSKVKFVTYEDGNSRINVLNGISMSKGVMKYDLNFIKIFKDNGDLLLDYDADNTQKRINMKKDLME